MKTSHIHASDIRAVARLATDATLGLTDLVERVHAGIARTPRVSSDAHHARGISGHVYRTVRGVTRTVGMAADAVLAQCVPLFGERHSSPAREAMIAAVNGVLGDYLKATGNALAIPMQLRAQGKPVTPATLPDAGCKLLVLVHGLCMNDLQWRRDGHNHGAALARDLGYTPLYLHYNSGLHISDNGRLLADSLEVLARQWPVPIDELVIIGHSMGGLVARSACHYGAQAGHAWPARLRKLVFLGTPHHGAPLEKMGNWLETVLSKTPYAAPFARLGMLRSAGITDLRHGNVREEDWQGRDRFVHGGDGRTPLALPQGVACYAIAGKLRGRLAGDGLVQVQSALGRHRDSRRDLAFTEANQWIAEGVGHLDLLADAGVCERIRRWLADGPASRQNALTTSSARATSR
ncbi:esterase/lipase family protein [Noviherbaspirillum sp.]|uniref:esterase/lipase family protein n=1 Tax=Noviherbaspirillum sp. TaxID=1926288 RepID=UPI002D398E1C|nr:alpha/beta fold hydrolase [Noviherbaspirillum sp.]HZW23260.1 alpha/beta fold hydrolase [Noviherbaspirillum sp.]